MTSFDIQAVESDLHRLDLRFASLQMRQPRLVDRLARSIEQNGQLVPEKRGGRKGTEKGTDLFFMEKGKGG